MNSFTIENILNEVKGTKKIPDYIIYVFLSLILFIDFIPHSKSIDLLYPQFLYLSILNLVAGVYLYINSNTTSIDIISIFKRSYVLKLYALFVILCGVSYFNAKNQTLILEKLIEFIVAFCLIINLIVLLKNRIDLFYKILFIISISAFFQACSEIYNLKKLSSESSLSTALYSMVKTTGNINILASGLTIKIPFILLAITASKGLKRLFLNLVLLIVTVIVFLTASRAAFISMFLIYAVYIIYYLKTNSLKKSTLSNCLMLLTPLLLSIFIVNAIFKKSNERGRFVSLSNRVKQINLADESANARIVIWKNSLQIIKENPLTGVGLGNYKVESIPYEKTLDNDSSISLHAHNDFLEIMVETGILNGLIYISLFVFIVFINLMKIKRSEESNAKAISLLALMMVLVYGIDSLFNFPMFRPIMLVFFCFIIALTIINTESDAQIENNKNKVYLVLIALTLTTTYFAFLDYKTSNLEHLIKNDIDSSFITNNLTADELVSKLPKYKNVLSTAESFDEYVGIYYCNEKKYDEAMKYFSKADKINPYFGRILFYKMIISNAKGNIDSAYIYAKKAFYMRPRNLNFYKMSTQFARAKNDNQEILKEHQLFIKYRNIPDAWSVAAKQLQKGNYNSNDLSEFINLGTAQHPEDSTLIQLRKNIVVDDYIKKAQNYLNAKKLNKSLEIYLKALKIDPDNADTMQNLAFNYYNMGRYEEAKTYFLNALSRQNLKSGRTEFFIANCYLKTHDVENACKYFNISNNKNYSQAKQLIKENCK